MEGTVSLNDWALKDHCLRTGEHQLDLQVQSDTNGNSPTVSQTFNVNWDYGCGPAGGLILVNSSGTFPAIEVDYVAIVTQPYSAPMYWRVDNGKWIAVPELVITETTITSYIRWGDTYWIEAGLIPAGSHVLGLQLKSPTLGDSNIIVCPFTVDGDYPRATPTVPGFAQSNLLMYIAIGVGVLALIVIGYVCYKRQTEKDSDEDAPIHATSILADA
jgi:hypothetical protein